MSERNWVIELPYAKFDKRGTKNPVVPLSLNTRMAEVAKRRIKNQLKADVQLLARGAKLPTGLAAAEITLLWRPRVVRDRDTDNPMPTVKALIDGLVAYGLVADDNHRLVHSSVVIEEPGARRPGLWLLIQERSTPFVSTLANSVH